LRQTPRSGAPSSRNRRV